MSVILKINGKQYEVDGRFGPEVSLNEYIRNVADLRGTKAMCYEGGCGTCIVAVSAVLLPDKEPRTFSVNSCLVSILSCHNWEITTVEGIGNRIMGYNVLQRRLAHFNGTQCGFCTPGWITNMYCLLESKKGTNITAEEIENSFAGNICRCTGYRPIVDAFKSFASNPDESVLQKLVDLEDLDTLKHSGGKCIKNCGHCKDRADALKIEDSHNKSDPEDDWCKISDIDTNEENITETIEIHTEEHNWFKAYNLEQVFEAMKHGDYKLIAGNTGQGVYHTDGFYPKNVIDIQNVKELKGYNIDVNLILGAGMTLNQMMEVFLKLSAENEDFSYLKQFYEHLDLVAHIPVRNIGTIAGNLCLKHEHKEFPSDVFLLLETVGAMVTIAEGVNKTSQHTLPEFMNVNLSGKVLTNVMIPPLSHTLCSVKTYKIMPRSQNAHAIVNSGFLFQFKHNTHILKKASIVYGGLSPNFIHATKTESALVGKDLYTDETLEIALKSLEGELVAVDMPPEPSAKFRKDLAISLFYKAILKLSPEDRINTKFRSGGDVIKRSTSKGTQAYETDKSIWPLNEPVPKLEALIQCSGESVFANDFPTQCGEVFAVFVTADVVPGSVVSGFDATEALNFPGVNSFYSAKDIPGTNTFTPIGLSFLKMDEEILCDKVVKFYGQPAGIIVADKWITAKKAAKLVKIEYSFINDSKPLLTVEDVLNSPEKHIRLRKLDPVEPTDKGDDVKVEIEGTFKIKGQYHFTMETQTCVVKPTEDGLEVYSATQWLDLTNVAIAKCLNVPINSINVKVRRVGGAYGSKISRSSQIACAAALVTHLLGKVCRFVLSIEDNMSMVGKRLPTTSEFKIGVNTEGEIQYLNNTFYHDVGCSFNESFTGEIAQVSNGYNSKRWGVQAYSVSTDTPSNTWCRAPGTTEVVSMIENMMEKIAFQVNKDPTEVRLANMKNKPLFTEMINHLKTESDYDKRLEEIKNFNENNRWRKKYLKLIPLSYGIMYFGNYNCIVSIYHGDGSVVILHGGIEMGQGINTKVAQVCAFKLGIPLEKVSVKPSSSFTSPNSICTGGSIGSETVAFATVKACDILIDRLKPVRERLGNVPWENIVATANNEAINLQASYACSPSELTPYEVYAVCALEVEVDILTGNHDVRRLDVLEDTGRSLSPEIDVGQIEGALVMGLGYWTSEHLVYDPTSGKLLTDRTWNYKPPGIKDIPADMRIYFRRNAPNEFGVLQSKTTGEPALCLTTIIIHAIRETVEAARMDAGYPREWVTIENPCTVENIYTAVGHDIKHYKLK